MKKIKTAKTISLLMVLLLVLQLVPLGTALAAQDGDSPADAENLVTALSEDVSTGEDVFGLEESIINAEAAFTEGEEAKVSDAEESLETDNVRLLSGTNIGSDGTGDAIIHAPDGAPPTGWDGVDPLTSFIKIFQSDGVTEIPAEEDGSYIDIPANAVINFQVGFHLTDSKTGDEFNPGDFFELSLPAGVEFTGTTFGTLTTQGQDFATWEITGGKLGVELTSAVQALTTEIWGKITFRGFFKYMEDLDPSAGTTQISFGGHVISIARRSGDLDPKPPEKSTLTKAHSYNPDTNEITWTVTVTPPGGASSYDYSGFTLIDQLTGAHTYQAGTFKVWNGTAFVDINPSNLTVEAGSQKLTYVFPSGHVPLGEQKIQYVTKINTITTGPSAVNNFKNTADLKRGSFDAAVAKAEDTFQMAGFFAKTGDKVFKGADGKSAYVEWQVKVKMPKGSFSLPNAKIIDTLPATTPGFAPHEFFDGSASVLGAGGATESKDLFVTITYPGSDTPLRVTTNPSSNGEYALADTNKKLTYSFGSSHPAANPDAEQEYILTYYTKISDWNSSLDTNGSVSVKNSATLEWTPSTGSGTGSGTSIGAIGISKPVIASGGLISKSTTANADFNHSAAASTINGDYIQWTITVNSNRIPMTDVSITDDVVTVTDHKFASDQPFTVKKNGEATGQTFTNGQTVGEYGTLSGVADGGFTFTLPSSTSDSFVITFYTKITQTALDNMYRGNQTEATKTFKNGVTLNGHVLTTPRVEATKTYELEMLRKTVGSYNHNERSITWTLRVNRNMLPMTNAVIADELLNGMVLFPAEDDLGVFRVKINGGAAMPLPSNIIFAETDTPKGFTLTLPDGSDQYEFTFKTYLTDDILDESFTSKPFSNKATLTLDKNTAGIESTSSTSITHTVIKKDTTYVSANKEDVITWEVQINPGRVELNNAWIEDILNDSLDLDKTTVKLYNGTVNSGSGNVTRGAENPDFDSSDPAQFEHGTKANTGKEYFKLRLPDGKNAYVLVFSTVVTAENVTISNSITLSGETGFPESTGGKSGVSVQDIYATAGSSEYSLKVQKLGADNQPLKDVEFILMKPNGQPFRKGGVDYKVKTGEDGIAIFSGLPKWFFSVKEVEPPTGYLHAGESIRAYPAKTADMVPVTPPHITVTNVLGKADVVISKVGASNLPLAGAEFELKGTPDYAGATEITRTATSNGSGIATFTDIPMGSYVIRETVVPDGHIISNKTITATVEYADVSTKTGAKVTYAGGDGRTTNELVNEPILTDVNAKVFFTKTNEGGTPIVLKAGIDGGSFNLTGTTHKGAAVNLVRSVDATGLVDFGQLTVGTYKITETSAPAGYLNLVEKDIFNVTIAYTDGSHTNVHVSMTPVPANNGRYDVSGKFKNTPAVTDVSFTKQSSGDDTIKLNGGSFKISGESEAGPYEDTATAKDGEVKFENVPVNANGAFYTIEELIPPPGYQLTNDKLTVEVTYETGDRLAVASPVFKDGLSILKNTPAPYLPGSASISVLKTDEDGNKLAGAVFTLYDSTGKTVAAAVSASDGLAQFKNIAPNASYTIRETTAPEGYELSNEVISVTAGDSTTHSFTMVNKRLDNGKGNIVITKTDENGVLLPGASFTLYDKDGKAIATAVSDATGTVRFADIPVGSYTIRETAAPEGFILSTELLSITLEKGATRSFTLINRRDEVPGGDPTGSVGLLKVNNNGERLAGAEFSLYDADGSLVARAVTGADGVARFTGLPFGTYNIRETVAPEGYQLFDGAQTVSITAETPDRSFTLRNTQEDDPEVGGWEEIPDEEVPGGGRPVDPGNKLPQTGGVPRSLFLLLAGLSLLGIGIFLLKGQKKQNSATHGTNE